jgi:hypothetical protein
VDFAERDKCKPVLLRLSLAGNLEKPHLSLYGTEWRERGYGFLNQFVEIPRRSTVSLSRLLLISFGKSRFKPPSSHYLRSAVHDHFPSLYVYSMASFHFRE